MYIYMKNFIDVMIAIHKLEQKADFITRNEPKEKIKLMKLEKIRIKICKLKGFPI